MKKKLIKLDFFRFISYMILTSLPVTDLKQQQQQETTVFGYFGYPLNILHQQEGDLQLQILLQ
jgi:hypothetical protein